MLLTPPFEAAYVFLEWLGPDGATDIVDQDIDATMRLQRCVDGLLRATVGFQIGVDDKGMAIGGGDFCGDVIDQFGAINQYDQSALLRSGNRHVTADTLRSTSDDDDLVGESQGRSH
jgi:hypothetical protein